MLTEHAHDVPLALAGGERVAIHGVGTVQRLADLGELGVQAPEAGVHLAWGVLCELEEAVREVLPNPAVQHSTSVRVHLRVHAAEGDADQNLGGSDRDRRAHLSVLYCFASGFVRSSRELKL